MTHSPHAAGRGPHLRTASGAKTHCNVLKDHSGNDPEDIIADEQYRYEEEKEGVAHARDAEELEVEEEAAGLEEGVPIAADAVVGDVVVPAEK